MGSLFGSKPVQQAVQQASPQVNQEPTDDKKKKLVRALLLASPTPEGDLSQVTTGRRKLLGN